MERRRFSRISFAMPASLMVGEATHSFDQVDNLSIGGCGLLSALRLPAGTGCRFRLPLDQANPDLAVEVDGEIIDCDGTWVRLRFTRITPENLWHLHNILRYNAPDPDRIEDEIARHPGLV